MHYEIHENNAKISRTFDEMRINAKKGPGFLAKKGQQFPPAPPT